MADERKDLSKIPILSDDAKDLSNIPIIEESPQETIIEEPKKPEPEYSLGEKVEQKIGTVLAPVAKAAEWVGSLLSPESERQRKFYAATQSQHGAGQDQAMAAQYVQPSEVANVKYTLQQLDPKVKQGTASKGEAERYAFAQSKMQQWLANPNMTKHLLVETPKAGPGMTGALSQDEVYAIARKYGVQPADLESRVGRYGGYVEGKENGIAGTATSVLEGAESSVGFGLGKLLDKVLLGVTDPSLKDATDEMQKVIRERQTGWRTAAEIGASLPVAFATAPKLAATGAAIAGKVAPASATAQKIGMALADATDATIQSAIATAASGDTDEFFNNIALGAGLGAGLQAGQWGVKGGVKGITSAAQQSSRLLDSLVAPHVQPSAQKGRQALDLAAQRAQQTEASVMGFLNGTVQTAEAKRLAKDTAGMLGFRGDEKEVTQFLKDKIAQEPRAIAEAAQAADAVSEFGKLVAKDVDQKMIPGWKKVFDYAVNGISDGKYVAANLDNKYGFQSQQVLNDLSQGMHKVNTSLGASVPAIEAAQKLINQLGVKSDADLMALYSRLENGQVANATEKQLADILQAHYNKIADEANATGKTNIQKLATTYLPHWAKTGDDRAIAFRQMGDILGIRSKIESGQFTDADLTSLKKTKEGRDLLDGMTIVTGNKSQWGDTREFIDNFITLSGTGAEKREGLSSILDAQFTANALHQRTGNMPEFLREWNIVKLMNAYTHDISRVAFLGKDLMELRKYAMMAHEKGDDIAANWYANLYKDLTGSPRDWTLNKTVKNAASSWRLKFWDAEQKAKSPTTKAVLKTMQEVPEYLASLQSHMYSNFLGLNAKAAIQNLSQVPLMTAPELGYAYGTGLAKKTLGDALVETRKYFKEGLNHQYSKDGYLSQHVSMDASAQDAIRGGKAQGALKSTTKNAIKKIEDIGMLPFSATENISRIWAVKVADAWTDDLLKGSPDALQALRRASGEYGRTVERLLLQGRQTEARNEIRKYLVAKTVFNYDRATMSQFARSAGPLFSAFTRWPSALFGEMAYEMRTKGIAKGMAQNVRKYGTQYAAGMLLAHLAGLDEEGVQESGLAKTVLGSKGVSGWMPVSSVLDPLESMGAGKYSAMPPGLAPVAKGAQALYGAAMAGEDAETSQQLLKAVDSALDVYLPVAPMVSNGLRQAVQAVDGEPKKRGVLHTLGVIEE